MFMDEEPKDWSEEDADEPQPEFEDLTADEQAEQALREADETMEWLKEYGPELAAQGMDVPKQLAELQTVRDTRSMKEYLTGVNREMHQAMQAIPELQHPGRTSWKLRDIWACLSLYVWDPSQDRMLTYAEAR